MNNSEIFPRPAYVVMDSWAGRTTHRIVLTGRRSDGKYKALWDDDPAFGRKRGSVIMPPRSAVKEKQK